MPFPVPMLTGLLHTITLEDDLVTGQLPGVSVVGSAIAPPGWETAGTMTAGQGFGRLPRSALITGYLCRLARESVPGRYSQERLAETLAVSPGTVAGWETGRRPLTALGTGRFALLRSVLAHLGAVPSAVRLMNVAVEADLVLDYARQAAGRHEPGDFHPLGTHVLRREVMELVAWPLSGRQPAGLAVGIARRGPVAVTPALAPEARAAVFDHFRRVAETAGSDNLLRRQALYLQSYDNRADGPAWMADQYRRIRRRRSGWTPDWPVARTLAACRVRYGDPALLVDFAEYGLADDVG